MPQNFMHRFQPGDVVAGRYRVLRALARGSMGTVYEVEGLELGETLALKTLRREFVDDEGAQIRFREEIHLARRVTHRNVCRVFDAGIHDDEQGRVPYLTMELLLGDSLEQHIAASGPLPLDEVLDLLRSMAAAIDAAHEGGVVHRDFKPANVILVPTPSGTPRVVVTDFGLAQARSHDSSFDTSSASLVGTPVYMAPEQVEGGDITPACDIYALGVVLFQMLTARVPFQAKNPLGTAVMRLEREAPSPRDHVPDLPRRWELTILRCLERRPKDRFRRAEEIIEALEGQRKIGLPRRQRRIRQGAAVLALAIVGTTLGIVHMRRRQPAETRPTGPVATLDPVQLTGAPGLEIDPAISPDGSRLAFSADIGGSLEIFVRSLAPGGGEIGVTRNGSLCVQPAWAPDGSRLAFHSLADGGIWIVPSTGGQARRITEFGSHPTWSPLGERIAFQEQGRNEIAERSSPAASSSTLWIVPVDGGAPERLTEPGEPPGGHGQPVFSPDGKSLAFAAGDRSSTQLWRLDLPTRELTLLAGEARINFHPAWSSDASRLLYVGTTPGGRDASAYAMWMLHLDPETRDPLGEPRWITKIDGASIRQLSIAPSGDSIVYSVLETQSELLVLSLDPEGSATGEAEVLVGEAQRVSRPVFSPTGAQLAFDRWLVGTNLDLWVLDIDSNDPPRRVTFLPSWDSLASWLPDGRLAFISNREDARGLWARDFATGRTTSLLDLPAGSDWARTSPDGTQVVLHRLDETGILNVFLQPLGDPGGERALTHDKELAGFPAISPDGRWVAYEVKRGSDTHVAVLGLEGEEPRVLTTDPGQSWPYSWGPQSKRIAYAALRDGHWNIWWISREDAETRQLTHNEAPNVYVRYPSWSPKGDRLVFERSRTIGDLWHLDLGEPTVDSP